MTYSHMMADSGSWMEMKVDNWQHSYGVLRSTIAYLRDFSIVCVLRTRSTVQYISEYIPGPLHALISGAGCAASETLHVKPFELIALTDHDAEPEAVLTLPCVMT